MSWVAAGVASAGITLGAVKWVSGNAKEKKAKRDREKMVQPFYDIQNEYYQNRNMANQMAQGGLPDATKDFYTKASERGLSAGVQGILGGGGNPNDIAKLMATYDSGVDRVAAQDAQAHLDNIKYFMGVNKDLAGQKTIGWAINKRQPYLNTMKELAYAQKAGEATKNEGVKDIMSSISSFGTASMNSGLGGSAGKGSFGGGMNSGHADTSKIFDGVAPGEIDTNRSSHLTQIADPMASGSGADDEELIRQVVNYIKSRPQ